MQLGLLKWLLALASALGGCQAWAQLDASQVNPQNLPKIWQCKGKYSDRELNLHAQLADFNPLLYVESPGMNVYITGDNSLQKPLWKAQGGTHLCFAAEDAGERSLHFLQIAESFLNPNRRQADGEYQRHPKFKGPSSCEALRAKDTGLFGDSEYLECKYVAEKSEIADYVYRGSLTPDYSAGSQGAAFTTTMGAITAITQFQSVAQSDSTAFVMVKGHGEGGTQSAIGEIQTNLSVRYFFDDGKTSLAVLNAAGIKSAKNVGVMFSDLGVSRDGRRLYVTGYIEDARKERQYRQFVVQIDSNGNVVNGFGTKGVALLDTWIKIDALNEDSPLIEVLEDGRLAVIVQTPRPKNSTSGYLPSRIALLKNGVEDLKFRETLAKNADLSNALARYSNRVSLAAGENNDVILIPPRESTDDKFTAFKISASGEVDGNYLKSVEDTGIFEKCRLDSVTHSRTGGWLIGGDCNKNYYILKVREDGRLDSSFGVSGVASSEQWQTQMKTATKLNSLSYTLTKLAETSKGDILVPMTWEGQMSGKGQSGFLKIKADGRIDTSFAMRGLLGGGLAESKLSMPYAQNFVFVNSVPMSVGTGYDNRNYGLIVRRYVP